MYWGKSSAHLEVSIKPGLILNPAVQQTNFQNPNLNVCFAQYRTFRSSNNQRNDWLLSARSGPSLKTGNANFRV